MFLHVLQHLLLAICHISKHIVGRPRSIQLESISDHAVQPVGMGGERGGVGWGFSGALCRHDRSGGIGGWHACVWGGGVGGGGGSRCVQQG